MEHQFIVPTGTGEKSVCVTVDPESGRTSIRVDGRLIAKPLAPDEESREITVGTDRYDVRRAWDGFEIEFLGPADAATIVENTHRRASAALPTHGGTGATPARSRRKPVVLAVLVAILGASFLYAFPIYTSAVAGWETYSHPDGSFSVSLPVAPKKEKEFVVIPGGATYTHTLLAARGSYEYAVSYFNLPRSFDHGSTDLMVDAMRSFILDEYRGEILGEGKSGSKAWMRVRFRDYETESKGLMSGDLHVEMRVTSDRAYIIGVISPIDKLDSAPARRFLYSFRIGGQPIMDIPEWVKL